MGAGGGLASTVCSVFILGPSDSDPAAAPSIAALNRDTLSRIKLDGFTVGFIETFTRGFTERLTRGIYGGLNLQLVLKQ